MAKPTGGIVERLANYRGRCDQSQPERCQYGRQHRPVVAAARELRASPHPTNRRTSSVVVFFVILVLVLVVVGVAVFDRGVFGVRLVAVGVVNVVFALVVLQLVVVVTRRGRK